MPHAETHTIILPHVLAYNAPSRYTRYYEEVSDGDATNGLSMLLQRLKVKRSLKDFGFKEEDIDKSAEIAVGNSYWNPRTIESSLSGSC
jgi:alcohol dehydrogenase class IV